MRPDNEITLEREITESEAQAAIQEIVKDHELVLFMKGNAMLPQCGFSGQVVEILKIIGVPFNTFNILENMLIREGVKAFSNWPTLPQLYYKGEFLGGCDIITDLYQTGELQKKLGKA